MIFGNGGLDREGNLKDRVAQIRDDMMAFLRDFDRNLTVYIYIMLQKAEYMEI